MSSFSSGPSSPVKSIQRGVISCAAGSGGTATITAVNTAKATLRINGFDNSDGTTIGASGNSVGGQWMRADLTNSTTVTASKASGAGSGAINVSFEVVEYN